MPLIGLFLTGMLAYWWFDERDERPGAKGTVVGVGNRADNALAGFMGAAAALVLVLISIVSSIGLELANTLGYLVDPIAAAPSVTGEIVISILALAGLGGVISLSLAKWVGIFAAVMVVALAIQSRPDTDDD